MGECARDVGHKIPIELYWVYTSDGAYFVADDQIQGFVEYSWMNPNLIALLESVVTLREGKYKWRRDVEDLSEYLEREGILNKVLERETVQTLIDEGRLGRRCLQEPLTLEERMFRPGMTPKLIGRNIRQMREARGLTVEKLAERMELDAATMLAYEDGTTFIFEEELVRIAEALEIDEPEMLLLD